MKSPLFSSLKSLKIWCWKFVERPSTSPTSTWASILEIFENEGLSFALLVPLVSISLLISQSRGSVRTSGQTMFSIISASRSRSSLWLVYFFYNVCITISSKKRGHQTTGGKIYQLWSDSSSFLTFTFLGINLECKQFHFFAGSFSWVQRHGGRSIPVKGNIIFDTFQFNSNNNYWFMVNMHLLNFGRTQEFTKHKRSVRC